MLRAIAGHTRLQLDADVSNAEICEVFSTEVSGPLQVQSPQLVMFRKLQSTPAMMETLSIDAAYAVARFGARYNLLSAKMHADLGRIVSERLSSDPKLFDKVVDFISIPGIKNSITPKLILTVAETIAKQHTYVPNNLRRKLLTALAREGHHETFVARSLFADTLLVVTKTQTGVPDSSDDPAAEVRTLCETAEKMALGGKELMERCYGFENGPHMTEYSSLPLENRALVLASFGMAGLKGTRGLVALLREEATTLSKRSPLELLALHTALVSAELADFPEYAAAFQKRRFALEAKLTELFETGSNNELVSYYYALRRAGLVTLAEKVPFERTIFSRISNRGVRNATDENTIILLCEIVAREHTVDPEFRDAVLARADLHLKSPGTFLRGLTLAYWVLAIDPTLMSHCESVLRKWSLSVQSFVDVDPIHRRCEFLIRACLDIPFEAIAPESSNRRGRNDLLKDYGWINAVCEDLAKRLPVDLVLRSDSIGLIEARTRKNSLIIGFPFRPLWGGQASADFCSLAELEERFVRNLRPDIRYLSFDGIKSQYAAMANDEILSREILKFFEPVLLQFDLKDYEGPEPGKTCTFD